MATDLNQLIFTPNDLIGHRQITRPGKPIFYKRAALFISKLMCSFNKESLCIVGGTIAPTYLTTRNWCETNKKHMSHHVVCGTGYHRGTDRNAPIPSSIKKCLVVWYPILIPKGLISSTAVTQYACSLLNVLRPKTDGDWLCHHFQEKHKVAMS